ncbi:MAG TPA: gfo/Idh/MocA family oxidoreductase, partial [Bacteroidales bacterium]|nr:gfo/Idh/MocA family oxidoreductase [Bacteroidales bacterium]
FQTWQKLVEAETVNLMNEDKVYLSDGRFRNSTANLVRNFLDCVKSRQTTYCTPEEGHRSTCLAHLATIALLTKERLEWDGKAERFTNSEKANQLLEYEYRKPYHL